MTDKKIWFSAPYGSHLSGDQFYAPPGWGWDWANGWIERAYYPTSHINHIRSRSVIFGKKP